MALSIIVLLPHTFPAQAEPASYEEALIMFVAATEGPDAAEEVLDALAELADQLTAEDRLVSGEPSAAQHLESWFFEEAQFRGAGTSSAPAAQPTTSNAIASRTGTCLPLAATYMVLAERTGVEATPIATPRHVFIRQETASGSVNIELLDGGRQHPDRYYLHQEHAPPDDPRAEKLLRPLSPSGLLAYLLNNHAVALKAADELKQAGEIFREALHLDPDCQPCLYNYGNLLAAEGKVKKARRAYDRALELHPWDEEAERNRARMTTSRHGN